MAWDLEQIVEILQECGKLALDIQLSARRSIKADDTLVTEADTRIEALIMERLGPNPLFIGEETAQTHGDEYHREALGGSCYVIDPVDGTMLYANGLPGWGVSIGYMVNGTLCEGAILFPGSGEILISRGSEVLYARSPEKPCPAFDELRPLPPPEAAGEVISVNQTIVKQGCYGGDLTVLSTGSCVSSVLYLAQGGSMGYLTKSRLWDLAGGIPLLFKLGIRAYSLDGREFSAEVSNEYWHIPPTSSETYWKIREQTLFCADRQSFEVIMQGVTAPS